MPNAIGNRETDMAFDKGLRSSRLKKSKKATRRKKASKHMSGHGGKKKR